MKKYLSLLLAMALVATVGAQKIVRDSNAEQRNVSGFHAVHVSNGIDLYLSQGDESVAVSAAETKYRDKIITEVKDGVLKIYVERKENRHVNIDWDWKNPKMKAYVSYKTLDAINGSGGSDINVDGVIKTDKLSLGISGGSDFEGKVEANELTVDASGGSDVNISGAVKNLTIDASGGSDFKGYELAADFCKLDASGGSDIHVTVNKELNAEASGGSDIRYKGTGVIRDMNFSGSSNIKRGK